MSQKKSTSPEGFLNIFFKAMKWGVNYIEKFFRFAWTQTGWVFTLSRNYSRWVSTLSSPYLRVTFFTLMPILFIPLWITLIFWGLIRSIF